MIKNLKNRNVLFLVAAFVVLICASACKKDQPQLPAPVPGKSPQVVKDLPKPIQGVSSSAVRLSGPSVNQFDFSSKKDPFKPFVVVQATPSKSPEALNKALRNALPIHSYDVNQFKLIGVITGSRESQAMVTDPGGKGYVLKVGMSIGKNDGKVTSISTRGVEVLEQFKDDNGRVRKEHISLTLPRKQ
jgi:type IV pilus assembly protein PilP